MYHQLNYYCHLICSQPAVYLSPVGSQEKSQHCQFLYLRQRVYSDYSNWKYFFQLILQPNDGGKKVLENNIP